MARWVEYTDSWAFEILPERDMHEKSIFEVEIYPGLVVTFGERKSKLGSRDYKLVNVYFLKETWALEAAQGWMCDHEIRYLDACKCKLKVPEPDFWVGTPDDLIEGGYIFAFWRNTKKDSFAIDFIQQVDEPDKHKDYGKKHDGKVDYLGYIGLQDDDDVE